MYFLAIFLSVRSADMLQDNIGRILWYLYIYTEIYSYIYIEKEMLRASPAVPLVAVGVAATAAGC